METGIKVGKFGDEYVGILSQVNPGRRQTAKGRSLQEFAEGLTSACANQVPLLAQPSKIQNEREKRSGKSEDADIH